MVAENSPRIGSLPDYLLVEGYVVVGAGDRINSAIMCVYMLY